MFGSISSFGASSSSSPFGASSNSSPFGRSSNSSPFGASSSSSLFGVAPATSNPFGTTTSPLGMNQSSTPVGAKPFGSPLPFGGQIGTCLLGSGTATGVFGVTQSTTFGAPSGGLGASTSSLAFGSGAPVFGQKPASPFGGSGTTQPQANIFGSPASGQMQALFTSQPFGSTTPAFGAQSASAFGSTSAPPVVATLTPTLRESNPLFRNTPASGASATPSPFGSQTGSPFVGPFDVGTSSKTTLGSCFGSSQQQRAGSRAAPYAATPDPDPPFGFTMVPQVQKFMSISAMPVYKNKSHEELRMEDYQAGGKGGPNLASSQQFGSTLQEAKPSGGTSTVSPGQTTSSNPFPSSTNSWFTSPVFGHIPPAYQLSTTGTTTPSWFVSTSASGQPSTSPAIGLGSTASLSGPASAQAVGSTIVGSSAPAFGKSTFGTSQPVFALSLGFGTSSIAPGFNTVSASPFGSRSLIGNTQASPAGALVQSSASQPLGATPAPAFGSTISAFGTNLLNPSTSASISSQTKLAGLEQSTPSSAIGAFGKTQAGQTQGVLNLLSFQTAQQGTNIFGDMQAPPFGKQNTHNLISATPVPVTNPFGTVPAMMQMPFGKSAGSGPSVQYGISSMLRSEKPTQVRTSSLLTPQHIAQLSKVHMHARRYHPKKDSPKVSFFSDADELPKADLMFIPRENPRALFICQPDQTSHTLRTSKSTTDGRDIAMLVQGNGESGPLESWPAPEKGNPASYAGPMTSTKTSEIFSRDQLPQANGVLDNQSHRATGFFSVGGVNSSKVLKNSHNHSSAIEALMPKLLHSDYFTEPGIQELAAKERADPGYSKQVVDFVVGRQGYGVVKFFGATDVQGLDLESIIQFNCCEVVVYMDESKKPSVGQGLNKPAEITLLNVKCVNKKSGQQYSDGPEVEKFEKRLKKKTEEQGAEFISYSALKGEWIFQVQHFSRYGVDMDSDQEER